jgi:hypothetical protein
MNGNLRRNAIRPARVAAFCWTEAAALAAGYCEELQNRRRSWRENVSRYGLSWMDLLFNMGQQSYNSNRDKKAQPNEDSDR